MGHTESLPDDFLLLEGMCKAVIAQCLPGKTKDVHCSGCVSNTK